MIKPFIPDIKAIPSTQDQINKTANELARVLNHNIVHFNTDIVFAIGIIADGLCHTGVLEREQLVQSLDAMHQDRKQATEHNYSPLASLATLLIELGKLPQPVENDNIPWLREVIEGGKTTEPAD